MRIITKYTNRVFIIKGNINGISLNNSTVLNKTPLV